MKIYASHNNLRQAPCWDALPGASLRVDLALGVHSMALMSANGRGCVKLLSRPEVEVRKRNLEKFRNEDDSNLARECDF